VMSKKILAIASGGGHFIQLLKIVPELNGCKVSYVTTIHGYDRFLKYNKVYVIKDASRDNKVVLLFIVFQLVNIFFKEKPDVVITTGAAPGFLSILLARVFGVRSIWIDSIANSEEISLSGRMASKYASLCLTQWPHLEDRKRKILFRGAVL